MSESEPDLRAVALRLRPLEPLHLDGAEANWRLNYQLFLQLIDARDPELATKLQEANQPRPFTVSELLPITPTARRTGHLTPLDECAVRFTGLNRPVVAALERLPEVLPEKVYIGEHPFAVEGVLTTPGPTVRVGADSYKAILERCFYADRPLPTVFRLHFLSPTCFRTDNQELPLPVPQLVFGSLLGRWNAFSLGPLADDSRLFAEINLKLAYYQIRSHEIMVDHQYLVGFTGRVKFRASSRERFYLQTIEALCEFSRFSGIGYKTTTGLGQVEYNG